MSSWFVGYFDAVLPAFLSKTTGGVSLLHVDCDLYFSTQTVLAQLRDRIVSGTIIVFDEYLNYPQWRQHEFRAFQEFVAQRKLKYEYIGLFLVMSRSLCGFYSQARTV